jgi:RNA polymerase sigma-70 factor (ECF subfamily)
MNKPDDTELVRRCMKGEQMAYQNLLLKYEKPVFNAAFRMLNNAEDARDVTQAVFLKVYENLGQFDPKYRFFSWIYRIAVNESIDFLKQRNRTEELTAEPEAQTGGPDDATDSDQRSQRIQAALMLIKPEYRSVIVLKHFLEFNYIEIGAILELPEKTVKSRLYSGRQLLKNALQEHRLN